MSCTNPLKAFPIGLTENGKTKYKITNFKVRYIAYQNDSWTAFYDDPGVFKGNNLIVDDYVQIPCGKCDDCRLKYSREWADRCMCEAQYHLESHFITLTYDDQHVPKVDRVDDNGRVLGQVSTLDKKQLSDFMKRLREAYIRKNNKRYDLLSVNEKKVLRKNCTLRFYACGEYGPKLHRPHYHLIVFGLQLDDLEFLQRSPAGFNYYTSEFVEKCWPFGFVTVCDVTWDTCAYVARYVMKKQVLTGPENPEFPWEPEFVNMSRKPGIGYQFYQNRKDDLYKYTHVSFSTPNGKIEIRPCRYYDNLYDKEFPEALIEIKENRRQLAIEKANNKRYLSSKDLASILNDEALTTASRIKVLKRGDLL